jgi:hypothetical protein
MSIIEAEERTFIVDPFKIDVVDVMGSGIRSAVEDECSKA